MQLDHLGKSVVSHLLPHLLYITVLSELGSNTLEFCLNLGAIQLDRHDVQISLHARLIFPKVFPSFVEDDEGVGVAIRPRA